MIVAVGNILLLVMIILLKFIACVKVSTCYSENDVVIVCNNVN